MGTALMSDISRGNWRMFRDYVNLGKRMAGINGMTMTVRPDGKPYLLRRIGATDSFERLA